MQESTCEGSFGQVSRLDQGANGRWSKFKFSYTYTEVETLLSLTTFMVLDKIFRRWVFPNNSGCQMYELSWHYDVIPWCSEKKMLDEMTFLTLSHQPYKCVSIQAHCNLPFVLNFKNDSSLTNINEFWWRSVISCDRAICTRLWAVWGTLDPSREITHTHSVVRQAYAYVRGYWAQRVACGLFNHIYEKSELIDLIMSQNDLSKKSYVQVWVHPESIQV